MAAQQHRPAKTPVAVCKDATLILGLRRNATLPGNNGGGFGGRHHTAF